MGNELQIQQTFKHLNGAEVSCRCKFQVKWKSWKNWHQFVYSLKEISKWCIAGMETDRCSHLSLQSSKEKTHLQVWPTKGRYSTRTEVSQPAGRPLLKTKSQVHCGMLSWLYCALIVWLHSLVYLYFYWWKLLDVDADMTFTQHIQPFLLFQMQHNPASGTDTKRVLEGTKNSTVRFLQFKWRLIVNTERTGYSTEDTS